MICVPWWGIFTLGLVFVGCLIFIVYLIVKLRVKEEHILATINAEWERMMGGLYEQASKGSGRIRPTSLSGSDEGFYDKWIEDQRRKQQNDE